MDDAHFMKKALGEAEKALKKGEFPVGCVMVHEEKIVATGSRVCSSQTERNELDHAELAALRRLVLKGPVIRRDKVIVFSTLEPCLMCFSALIVNGIRKFVYAYEDVFGGGTDVALSQLKPFYRDIRIEVVPGILREKSIGLFREFFSNSNNDYLRGTLLAEHALGGQGSNL